MGSRRENLESMRSLPQPKDAITIFSGDSSGSGDMEDEWSPPELGDTLELTAGEQELLAMCDKWEAFRELPSVDLDATEMPQPWKAVDYRKLLEHEEEVCNREMAILQAYSLLQDGIDQDSMLLVFAHMDALMHFPHHTFISTSPGAPPGKEATEHELTAFRSGRRTFLEMKAAELRRMRPEQRLQMVKSAAMSMCITSRDCVQAAIINKTPERAAKWEQAIQRAQEGAASRKKRSRSRSRRSNASSSKGTKAAKLDKEFEEDLARIREQMDRDRELVTHQVDMMRGIKAGMEALATTQQQTANVLNQVGAALAQLLQKN